MKKLKNNLFYESFIFFSKRKMSLMAGASTFYLILNLVPFCLLLVRFLGLLIGDQEIVIEKLLIMGKEFFPDLLHQVYGQIGEIITSALFASNQATFLNLIMLLITSFFFVNAIWSSFSIILKDKNLLDKKMIIKSCCLLAFSLILLVIAIFIPLILKNIAVLVQNVPFVTYLTNQFGLFKNVLIFMASDSANFINIFNNLLIFSFITLIYQLPFKFRNHFYHSLKGASAFFFLFIFGKTFFKAYLDSIENGVMQNYGKLYIFIVTLLWIYFVMMFFYYGLAVSKVSRDKALESV